MKEAYKETTGKLFYELDFGFITQMAERMAVNKSKYKPYNWHNLDNIADLQQSLFRHTIEVMNGNYKDEERELGHLEALACNAMMICYQLKNHKNAETSNTEDLDIENTAKSFLPKHNPTEFNFDEITGFFLDDVLYKIIKIEGDFIMKQSVISGHIYEFSKQRFMKHYYNKRIRILKGKI